MKIGELAKKAGVSIDTVRYYEREGVLPIPRRRDSGYRRYDAEDLTRLQFVRRAKALGFSLHDIAELLTLSDQSHNDMAGVRHAAESKLLDVNNKLAELTRIKLGLDELLSACPGHGDISECPIMAALSNTLSAPARSELAEESIDSGTKKNSATSLKKSDAAKESSNDA